MPPSIAAPTESEPTADKLTSPAPADAKADPLPAAYRPAPHEELPDNPMVRWICPRCDREFARANQSHTCVPGCTVDTVFAPRRPEFRVMYDAIVHHLRTLGPVHEDAVSIGVFLKCDRKLAEVRPRSADILLYLYLPLRVHDPRIRRVYGAGGSRVVHELILREPAAVDEFVRDLLTRAFLHASD